MMKFKKQLAAALLCCSLVAVGGCSKANNSGGGDTPTQDVIDPFKEGTTIFVGDTVTISPREIEKDGEIYPCYDFYTITPDGNRLSGTKQFISIAGQYETVFMAKKDDGSFITDSDRFVAYEKAFSVEKETSSTKYVDKVLGDYKNTTPGITATLSEGDTWHYNQIIDISNSNLTRPIIKFYSSPMSEFINGDVAPFIDATKQILRITDYYDPTNYIDVQIGYFLANQGTGRMQTYAVAGGSYQTATGLMQGNHVWGTRRLVNLDGIDYTCCFGFDEFGCTMGTAPGWKSNRHPEESTDPKKPYFNPDITNSDGFGYSVFYDSTSKRIYIQHNNLYFVTDLGASVIYNDNLFKGFTTGEVTLSLRFDGYKSSSATFEITEIYGKKGEELKETRAIDDKAPEIYVDCPENNLYIARNEEFTVPLATARDANLKGGVEKEVIFEKGTSFEKYIPLVDGKFTPTDVGEYTITYTAKDTFNNESSKEIKCMAVNCENDKLVKFSFKKFKDSPAGTTLEFSKPGIESPNGKGLYANLIIVGPDGVENKYNALRDEPINYLLRRVGKYKVMYEYGDVAKSYVESYEFNSVASENIYLDTTIFPTYFIKGAKASLEDNKAVLCDTTDVHYIDATIEVMKDGDKQWNKVDDIYNFVTDANQFVNFRYSYNNQEIYVTDSIPVIDVGFDGELKLDKYFNGSSWKVELEDNDIKLTTSSNEKVDFINSLSFSSFSIRFNFLKGSKFDRFSLILKDYYDSNNIVNIDFENINGVLYFVIGEQRINLGDTSSFYLNYDYVSSCLYYGSSTFVRFENPFVNDRFNLSFKFDNPKQGTGIQLTSLYNQSFKKTIKKDTVKPVIAFNSIAGYYSLNNNIKIDQTYVCDVLTPYVKAKHELLVEYQTDVEASREIVKSVDGINLDGKEDADRDYHIILNRFGVYTLTYTYTDQFNNKYYSQDVLYCVDDKGPVITIEGATSSTIDTCGLNAEVKIRNCTVVDESEYTLTTYAISPTDVLTKIENNKFKATSKGLWKVVYYAVDSVGNIGIAYYQVNCQ